MMSSSPPPFYARPISAVVIGAIVGLGLLVLAHLDHGTRSSDAIRIGINGVSPRQARDLLLPRQGWTLQVALPIEAGAPIPDGLVVALREERTGLTVEIQDRMRVLDGAVSFQVPEELGLAEGLLAIRASLVDAQGHRAEDWMRVRIRPWLGGPPIGARQVIYFDFSVDRDADGRPDFHQDLERLGLAHPDTPEITAGLADRIAARALERVLRAFDPSDDPNRTGAPRDVVRVRFQLEASQSPYVTRICIGGRDPNQSASVGHVRFDLRNAHKSSQECGGQAGADSGAESGTASEITGLFPSELATYREAPLYREVVAAFDAEQGGRPIGSDAGDAAALAAQAHAQAATPGSRAARIERAIEVFGDVLGSIMAHETGHALGLVAEGKPGVGLFGGAQGDRHLHNLDPDGMAPQQPWLMNDGRSLGFEELAGLGEGGELRFRPLNHAYLRDRVVLIDARSDD